MAKTEFTIHWVPPTLNRYSRAHWSKQRKWVEDAAVYILAKVGRSTQLRRVRVTFQQYRRRPTDLDNATPKVLCDALVRLGWAVDDSEQWMEQNNLPVKVAKQVRTIINIEEI